MSQAHGMASKAIHIIGGIFSKAFGYHGGVSALLFGLRRWDMRKLIGEDDTPLKS
jgi:hypothetical protein